jgi:hypothetical protein
MLVDVEQGSVDWLQMRIGCVTGSRVADVLAKLKRKEGEAAVRANYKAEIVSEQLTGRAWEHFVSREMRWGIENEIFARNAYEMHVDDVKQAGHDEITAEDTVERVGFALHDRIKRFGASPDALVGEDGLAEFKCPATTTHIDYIIAGVVPAEYQPQMLAEMACTGRQWCDFVSYDPRLPKRLQLFIRRFERDDARIAAMEAEVEKFLAEVDEQIAKLKDAKMVNLDTSLETELKESLRASLALKG